MADRQTDPFAELKKIAEIKVDRERHRLAAAKAEQSRLEDERRALHKQIDDLQDAKETNPASLINAYAYLESLSSKARQLDADRAAASQRTQAQREKIKHALASKIRVDGMDAE